jgi:hypothetical protein
MLSRVCRVIDRARIFLCACETGSRVFAVQNKIMPEYSSAPSNEVQEAAGNAPSSYINPPLLSL